MHRLPHGLPAAATLEDGVVTAVTGNTCPRGDAYARKECVHPERTVTGTVRVLGGPLPVVPVRTQGEVPKEKVLEVARALHTAAVPAPVQAGQVAPSDVCGTGACVVAKQKHRLLLKVPCPVQHRDRGFFFDLAGGHGRCGSRPALWAAERRDGHAPSHDERAGAEPGASGGERR